MRKGREEAGKGERTPWKRTYRPRRRRLVVEVWGGATQMCFSGSREKTRFHAMRETKGYLACGTHFHAFPRLRLRNPKR
jgi:hypothetical protein